MKTKQLLCGALLGALTATSWAEAPQMKMTTEIPPGIETPDVLETAIGTLTSVNGVPDAETTQKVYDNLDLNRATEAFLNCIPISSMARSSPASGKTPSATWRKGTDAEVIFDAVPGRIFKGKFTAIIPVIPEAAFEPSGSLRSGDLVKHHGRLLALIELDADLTDLGLPVGVQGRAAVYAEHDALHSSPVRNILLRMMG